MINATNHVRNNYLFIALLFFLTCFRCYSQDIPKNPNLIDVNGRQGTWTILFDENWQVTDSLDKAVFYRLINYHNDAPVDTVKDYYISGQIQMEGIMKSDRPEILDGLVKFYNQDGSIENVEFFPGDRNLDESIHILTKDNIHLKHKSLILALANLYHANRMKEANPLYEKYAKMVKKEVGENSLAYADALRFWAWDYLRHRDYINAEPLFFQSKGIIDKQKDKNMRLYAQILNDIGDYYTYVDRYEEGLKYLSEANLIAEKHTPENDYLRFIILHNTAACYRVQGDYEKALENSAICVKDARNRFGKYHRETANTIRSLIFAYDGLGQYENSQKLWEEILEIYEVLYGKEHSEYLDNLYSYGMYHIQTGQLERGAEIYLEVYNQFRNLYGNIHPTTIRVQRSYGFAKYRLGEREEAISILKSSATNRQKYLHEYFDYMNEEAREALYNQQEYFTYFQTSLTMAEGNVHPELIADLLNTQLQNKALLISTSNAIKKRILESNDRKLIELYNETQKLKQLLGSFRDLSDNEIKSKYQVDRDSIMESLENKDRNLNRLSSIYAIDNEAADWEKIREKLNKNEALVEIHRYQEFNLEEWKWTNSIRYIALIVTSKTQKTPKVIQLNNGNYLEDEGITNYSNKIKFKIEDRESYTSFWEPLEKELKKYDKVYFSAAGIYHKINLQTLYNPTKGTYLLEEKDIQIITSGRDLLEEQRPASPVKLGMLIGNPSFGDIPQGVSGTKRGIELLANASERAGIAPLPGAEKEVQSIAKLLNAKGWQSVVLLNEDAEESALKDMLKPNVLHIATHGFFHQDDRASSNVLNNTGLLFTGAAKSLFDDPETGVASDGILTSFEAINLNIDNTNLVVLSACETGLGELKNGEGIYGLQRAFKIAGARSIIMSLWKVDDEATNKLMTSFYDYWLNKSLSKRDAFKQAQLDIKKKYPEPYYWGAFVVLGE